jgi:branched-chain amino acid aminotransferase
MTKGNKSTLGKAPPGKALTYARGRWHDGNPMILGPKSHAVWLSSVVFDGARAFQGVAPDLGLHCGRVVDSARLMGLDPMLTGAEIEELAWEGIARFPADAELYICPMFYAEDGFLLPDPKSTAFALAVYESKLPAPTGFSACLSTFRRPARNMAPTEAKASCLYPNVARSVAEANRKGFDTGIMLDPADNVAEFSYTNLFLARDGIVHTPVPNGTFLNGLTRQRIVKLLREDGVTVIERAIRFPEVLEAEEVFATGNYFKVGPCTRIEDKTFPIGPLFRRARELYMDFAHGRR